MSERVCKIVGHLLPQPCSGHAMSPLDSPTGKVYPEGTDACLKGNMEPVSRETSGPLVCIHGALPPDLDGFFLRTGPNPALNKDGQPYHAFNGDAMIHLFDLHGGEATYRNRWVQTQRLKAEKSKGEELELGEMFDEDGLMMGAANTALVYHSKQLMAVFESDRPYVVSLPDLQTVGQQKYNGALKHNMTAHPKVCPRSGEMFFFGYDLMRPMIHYSVVNSGGELVSTLDIPTQCGKPVMMHDMAITQNYAIIMEFPLCFERRLAMKGLMPYAHDTSKPSQFGILPRHAKSTEEIRWFKGSTGVAFHTANAWEEGGKVKLVAGFSEKFVFFDPDAKDGTTGGLYEWTFDMTTGGTEERYIAKDSGDDFLQINPKMLGVANQYVWSAHFTGAEPAFHAVDSLLKHDLSTNSLAKHTFVGGRFGGESVFAARANPTSEDDGYLLCCTYNPKDKSTELYIVDAKTMDPNPVAILKTPQRAPFGFHAFWLPRSVL